MQTFILHDRELPFVEELVRDIYCASLPATDFEPFVRDLRRVTGGREVPSSLRVHRGLHYRIGSDESLGIYPALVMPLMRGGEVRGVELLYLDHDLLKAAPVIDPHQVYFAEAVEEGLYMPLYEPSGGVYGVAKGLDSALAAAALSGIPTCAINKGDSLAAFQIPPGVTRLAIFATTETMDEAQALALAAEAVGVDAQITAPDTPQASWFTELLMSGAVPVDDIAEQAAAGIESVNPPVEDDSHE